MVVIGELEELGALEKYQRGPSGHPRDEEFLQFYKEQGAENDRILVVYHRRDCIVDSNNKECFVLIKASESEILRMEFLTIKTMLGL
jgi:hypothetical protein